MSTTDTTNTTDDDVSFDPEDIAERLPDGLAERHEGILTKAIRNPDAAAYRIADSLGVAHREVRVSIATLHKVKTQDVDADEPQGAGTREATEKRGSARLATSFSELTEKQQAIIDYVARAPPDEADDMTRSEIAAAVNSSPEYDVLMAESYPEEVLDKYEWLVHERRKTLRQNGELERAESDEILVYDGGDLDVRATLAPLVGHLPDSNLDDLPERREQRADATFESASDMTETEPETTSDETDETDEPEIDGDGADTPSPVPASDVVQLPDEVADPDRLEGGTAYWAKVKTMGDRGGVTVHLNQWGPDGNSSRAIKGQVYAEDTLQDYAPDDILAVTHIGTANGRLRFAEVPLSVDDAEPEAVVDPVKRRLDQAQRAADKSALPPGAEVLPDDASEDDVEEDTKYWAKINGKKSYGVFPSLTKWNSSRRDDVSGLLPNRHALRDHNVGDRTVVELDDRTKRGLKFREADPDVPQPQPEPEPEPEPEADDEPEETEPETDETEIDEADLDDETVDEIVTAADAEEDGEYTVMGDPTGKVKTTAVDEDGEYVTDDALADELGEVHERIDEIETRLDAMDRAITKETDGLRETIRSAVAGSNQSLADFSTRLGEIEGTVERLTERVYDDTHESAPETRGTAAETILAAFDTNPAYDREGSTVNESGDSVEITFEFTPVDDGGDQA